MMYLVESWSEWFVTEAPSKQLARTEGIKEFGRNGVKSVSPAKQSDIEAFIAIKGKDALRN